MVEKQRTNPAPDYAIIIPVLCLIVLGLVVVHSASSLGADHRFGDSLYYPQVHPNVESILAEFDDPLIPEGGVDLISTCNTCQHLEAREEYFRGVARYLRPGGRLAIIEPNGRGWFQRVFPHFTEPEVIRAEMEAAGYRRVEAFDYLERLPGLRARSAEVEGLSRTDLRDSPASVRRRGP